MAAVIWPLRISPDRVALYGSALFIVGLWPMIPNTLHDRSLGDWACFWAAGATAGTRALMDIRAHMHFEVTHGVLPWVFPYPPGFAWLYAPTAHLSLITGYALNTLLMFALAIAAGVMLANVFNMPRWFGVIATLAWAPIKLAALGGQNTTLALFLIALAIVAAKRGSSVLLGLAIGMLLYKPTVAATFLVLLLFRREWRALAIVAICAVGWYFSSVAASGGDWAWFHLYRAGINFWYMADFAVNYPNTTSITGALMRFGLPALAATLIGVGIFVASLPRLLRCTMVDALAITSLLALAISPHAWQYEPAIMLPFLFYAVRSMLWPVVATYVVAELAIFTVIPWNVLVVPVLCWTLFVVCVRLDAVSGVVVQSHLRTT